ncbi:unnamed protein product [Adineta steineri]|uniref:G-protein coupled receptors family 1 profile domain-containing protein n=2 Tax=Adineta steineri TaxID=433720 RepID=A0A814A2F7_9BILA|nr:unnamed protein product [Adineta steineri]
MSTSSATKYEIIESNLNRYFCIILLILGTFGNTCNICIFIRPKLRPIPCSWYFLASTCANFIALYMGCLTRVLTTFNIGPQTTIALAIYCKTRSYLIYGSLSLSIWLIIGACIDRWASSCRNTRIRSFSNVKIAKRVIIGLTFIIYLIYGQMFYCFNGTYDSTSANCFTLIYGSLSLSIWLIIGACIDRWASSCRNTRIRSFSNVKIAKRVIIGLTFIIYLIYGQMFYCFNGTYDSTSANCFTISAICQWYNSFALFFTYSFFPCLLMLIFGSLTICNVRRSQQRLTPTQNILLKMQNNKKKTPKQMAIMLFVQVICSIILSLPISIQNIYSQITINNEKSYDQQRIEEILDTLFVLVSLMNSSISFYIFTLTGQIFREELKKFLFCKFRIPLRSS